MLQTAWAPGAASNYRAKFLAQPADSALRKIMLGMGTLSGGELAGERMEVAYQTTLAEDEHSCFSDNTHNDIRFNQLGIQNVYEGHYERVDGTMLQGTGLKTLLTTVNSTRATELTTAVAAASAKTAAIQPPFDQEILNTNPAGRARVKSAIDALRLQADRIVQAADALGISLVL